MTEQEIAALDSPDTPGPPSPPDAWSTDLPAFAELIASLSDVNDVADDSEESLPQSMDLDEITLSLAIELEVRDAESAQPRVTGSTPTQWTETTVLPVFHRLSMRVARESDA